MLPPLQFPTARCLTVGLVAITLLFTLALTGESAAAPTTKTLGPAVQRGTLVTYRIKGIRPRDIRHARLSTGLRRQALPLKVVRSAAARGSLKVRLRKAALRPQRGVRTRTSPKLVLTVAGEQVTLATGTLAATKRPVPKSGGPKTAPAPAPEPAPATTEPAPTTTAPAPTGSCPTFGAFGKGTVPGACWRPYADTSPFNRKIPAGAPVVPNSTQIVQRMTSFGPAQHIRGKVSGTEKDAGHPVYWSQPTDPEFTVDCVEPWGLCAIEGHKVRIPVEAQESGDTDHHMAIIDQATGWEYDFWTVRPRNRSGGTIQIGWGGRTRIDGDGLGSDAQAGKYGNLAGKLRVEELEAGRIDHALFLFARCTSGTTVFPAGDNPGRACSDIGESNLNAPPMGARVQLDMTPAEIDALNVPAWRKTIFRAMAEYGMIMGDTGGAWGIKEESGLSHTVFGQKDKWVDFAEKNAIPYYAADDVFIYNVRDGVDWRTRLRVVDPCVSRGTC